MPQIEKQIRINAPKQEVWRALADLGEVHQFHPFVKQSFYTSDKKEGKGACRRCELKSMGWVEEEVTDWQDGESFTLTIARGEKMPPFATNRFRQTLREDGKETILGMHIDYSLKYGVVGRILDKLLFRPQLAEKLIPGYLDGLKKFVEARNQPAAWAA
jgi:uncharacterized membrane protein